MNATLDAAARWDGPVPGSGRTRIVVAGAAPPSRRMGQERVEFVAELPRTATGKLQKFKLREPFWAGRDRQVGYACAPGFPRRNSAAHRHQVSPIVTGPVYPARPGARTLLMRFEGGAVGVG